MMDLYIEIPHRNEIADVLPGMLLQPFQRDYAQGHY
ncbi:hypothetical protein QSI_4319, partial [Clostridioides difficile P28]